MVLYVAPYCITGGKYSGESSCDHLLKKKDYCGCINEEGDYVTTLPGALLSLMATACCGYFGVVGC